MDEDDELQIIEMAPNPNPNPISNPIPIKVIDISSGDEPERRPDPAGFDSLLGVIRPNKARKKKKRRRKRRRSWHPFFRPAEAFVSMLSSVLLFEPSCREV